MRCQLGLIALLVSVVGVLGACGDEIGDECTADIDCSSNGDRTCIDASQDGPGYCTIRGCDFDTCPDEAACIRFYTGTFDKTCDPTMPETDCSFDEACAINGHCVSRSSEIRYCMRTCDSDGDCRSGYECRDLDKMKAHGGEPVLEPGQDVMDSPTKFCARAVP